MKLLVFCNKKKRFEIMVLLKVVSTVTQYLSKSFCAIFYLSKSVSTFLKSCWSKCRGVPDLKAEAKTPMEIFISNEDVRK